jgi:hypothetical protein
MCHRRSATTGGSPSSDQTKAVAAPKKSQNCLCLGANSVHAAMTTNPREVLKLRTFMRPELRTGAAAVNPAALIQCSRRLATGWTPVADARDNYRMMPPRPPLTVVKLSDHFGQYILTLKCECGHTRTAQPQTLAALAGWDALLADVVKRLRCSQCGTRGCQATVRPETKRDG